MSMSSFNKFSLRINSKISVITFCIIWLHFYLVIFQLHRGFVSFVPKSHEINTFLKLMLKLSGESQFLHNIKLSDLQETNFLKGVLFILFCFRFLCFTSAEKVLYNVFTRNILGIVRDHAKVYISFFFVENSVTKTKFIDHITHNGIYFSRE